MSFMADSSETICFSHLTPTMHSGQCVWRLCLSVEACGPWLVFTVDKAGKDAAVIVAEIEDLKK